MFNQKLKQGTYTRAWMSMVLCVFAFHLSAQVPEGYYDNAEGLSNGELKTALHNIIKVGKRLEYGSGSGATWSGFEKTDRHPEGHVWDMYSSNKVKFPGNGGAASGMNIEHSLAKSWWGGTKNDAYRDLYHLNPSNATANTARSNYPLGITNGSTFDNGVIEVGNNTYGTEYSGLCFEPLDEYKGDFARAYLYMFTCYEDFEWKGNAPTMLNMTDKWPMLKPWAQSLLVEWCRMDPVSEKELNRAAAIYEIQENRNPYIDYPDLVEYLWGNLVGQPFTTNSTTPVLTSPINGSTMNLPEAHFTATSSLTFKVRGKNIEGDVTLALSGEHASLFTLDHLTLSAEEVMAAKEVTVTFNPVVSGAVRATLTISGANLERSTEVTLTAEATDNFMALEATEVHENGFTANWSRHSQATGYQLYLYEYRMVDDAEVKVEDASMNEKPENWDIGGYTDFSSGMVRLASGGQEGTLTTTAFDLSKPTRLVVKAKRYGSDSNAILYVTLDGVQVAAFETASSTETFEVELSAGEEGSELVLKANKGKRVYIDHLTLIQGGIQETQVLLEGYPVACGAATSYEVSGLSPNTRYAYAVGCQGASSEMSEPMEVTTLLGTGIEEERADEAIVSAHAGVIAVKQLSGASHVAVYDVTGATVAETQTGEREVAFEIGASGFYVVKVSQGKNSRVVKVML